MGSFHLYNKIVRGVLRVFFPKADTVYETPPGDEPAVFICNHSGIRGPIIMTLHFKRRHSSWVINFALDKEKASNYAYHDIFFGDSRKREGFWRALSRMIAFSLPPLLNNEDVIPVYHDGEITKTFRKSLSALNDGKDLVIFAESPERYTEYVNRLQPGFVDIARIYHRRTGRRLRFYPVYIEKKNAVISVGEPIEFDPDIPAEEQRRLISDLLCDRIDRLARKLPPHKPAPFLPQRWYDAYGERFEHDTAGYWQMIDDKR